MDEDKETEDFRKLLRKKLKTVTNKQAQSEMLLQNVDSIPPTDSSSDEDQEQTSPLNAYLLHKRLVREPQVSAIAHEQPTKMTKAVMDLNKSVYFSKSTGVDKSGQQPMCSTMVNQKIDSLVQSTDATGSNKSSGNRSYKEMDLYKAGSSGMQVRVLQTSGAKSREATPANVSESPNFMDFYQIQSQAPLPLWSAPASKRASYVPLDEIDATPFISFRGLKISFDFTNFDNLFSIKFRCVGCSAGLNAGVFPQLLPCMHSVCLICAQNFSPGYCPKCLYFCDKMYPHFLLNALTILHPGKANCTRPLCIHCKSYSASYKHGDEFLCKQCMVGFGYPEEVESTPPEYKEIMEALVEHFKKDAKKCITGDHRYSVIGYSALKQECFCLTCTKEYGEYKQDDGFSKVSDHFVELAHELPPFNAKAIIELMEPNYKRAYFSYLRAMVEQVSQNMKTKETVTQQRYFKKTVVSHWENEFNKLAKSKDEFNNHLVEIFKMLHLCATLCQHNEVFFGIAKWMPAMVELVNTFATNRFYSNKCFAQMLPRFKTKPDEFNDILRVSIENSFSTQLCVKRLKKLIHN